MGNGRPSAGICSGIARPLVVAEYSKRAIEHIVGSAGSVFHDLTESGVELSTSTRPDNSDVIPAETLSLKVFQTMAETSGARQVSLADRNRAALCYAK